VQNITCWKKELIGIKILSILNGGFRSMKPIN